MAFRLRRQVAVPLAVAAFVFGLAPSHDHYRAVAIATDALAQESGSGKRSDDFDRALFDARRALLMRLEDRARAVASPGTPAYYSILRQGLSLLSAAALDPARLDRLVAEVIEGLDDDREAQGRIDRSVQLMQSILDSPVPAQQHGSPSKIKPRMVGPGSHRLDRGDFTQTVAIMSLAKNLLCTGTVIAPGIVLTAAHCVCELGIAPNKSAIAHVQFGNPDLALPFRSPARVINSATLLFDENFCAKYSPRQQVCSPDIAVIRYEDQPDLGYIKPARLPTESEVDQGLSRGDPDVVGYGETDVVETVNGVRSKHRVNADSKLVASIPVLKMCSTTTCSDTRHGCLGGLEVILVDSRGDDSCRGDSGGPAFLPGPYDATPILMAVVSRSFSATAKCGAGGIYVKTYTPAIRDWLCKIEGVRQTQEICGG